MILSNVWRMFNASVEFVVATNILGEVRLVLGLFMINPLQQVSHLRYSYATLV